MTRNMERQDICQMMGAIKGRRGWTDKDLARKIGCHTNTVRNMRKDPGRTKYETVRALNNLYFEICGEVRR